MTRLKALLLLIPLACTIVAASWFLDRQLDRRMAALKETVLRELEGWLSRSVRYGSLSPSIFGFLDIRDLQIGGDGEADTLLRVARLRVHYSLPRLLLERDIGRAVSEITIYHSTFTVDTERDRVLLELLRDLAVRPLRPQAPSSLPPVRISGDDITLNVRSGAEEVHLSRLFFSLSSLPEAYQLTLRAAAETRGRYPAAARLRLSGSVDRDLQGSDLLVRLESLRTESFALERQTFQVSLQGSRLDVRKIQDRAPLDLHVVYDLDTRRLDVHLMSQDFKPATMIGLSGPLKRYEAYLQNLLTVSGDISYAFADRQIRYDLEVQTHIGEGLLPAAVELSARLVGDRDMVQLKPIRIASERGKLEFDGSVLLKNLYPDGMLQLMDVRALSEEPLSASLQLVRGARSVRVNGGRLVVGPLALKDLSLELTPRPDRFLFDLRTSLDGAGAPGALRSQGQLVFRSGFPRFQAADRKNRDALADLELQADNLLTTVPLAYLRTLLPNVPRLPPAVEKAVGGLQLSASVGLSTDFRDFRLGAPLLRIDDPQDLEHGILAALAADPRSLILQDFSFRWGKYRLTGDLSAGLQPESAIRARMAFRWQDIPYEVEARYQRGGRLELSGSYGFAAQITFPPPSPAAPVYILPGVTFPLPLPGVRGVQFNLQAEEVPLPLSGGIGKVLASTRVKGGVDAEGRLSLESGRTVVRDFPLFQSRQNRLELAFSLERSQLQLRRVSFTDRISTLEGSGRATITSPTEFDGTLQLESRKTGEEYSLHLQPHQGRIDSTITFQRSPLERFGEYWVTGSLSGEARVEGTPQQPQVSGSFLLNDGRINDDPIGLSLSYRYAPGEVQLDALNLSFLTHRIRGGAGRLDFGKGEYRFQSQYEGDYSGKRLRLRALLDGTFTALQGTALQGAEPPATGDPPVSAGLAARVRTVSAFLRQMKLRGQLQLADIRLEEKESPPWTFTLAEENEEITLSGGPGNSIRGRFALDGSFIVQLLAPLPIRGEAKGRLEGRKIESRFAVAYLDARVINFLAHNEVFLFTAGVGRGELQINGPVNDPDFLGRLDVSGGSMKFALTPSPVEPIEGSLVFNEKSFTLPRTVTRCGGAEVAASGTFSIDHGVPDAFELLFEVNGRNGLQVRYPFGPVNTSGYAWGSVHVQGGDSAVRVKGDILVDRCQIAIQEPQPVPPPSRRRAPLTAQLNITTGKGVEFFWPSLRFPIIRTFAKQGEKVSILSDDAEKTLAMTGEVETRGGEIFYFDRSFYLKEGRITFRESGTEFDPRIQALAELRERDQNNEQIRIYLQVNDKLSQFSPRFYSVPSRTDAEITALVGGSIANRVGDTRPEISAMLLASDMASQFFIMRPFEQAVRDLLRLDMFSIRTQMVQNVLFGKLLGAQLPGSTLNPLDNTTLSLGKYLGTDLFLEMQLRFQTADITSSPLVSTERVRTEGEFSFEWQTPLFLLEWTFTPKHPETLFLTDNSLGLSWGFSY